MSNCEQNRRQSQAVAEQLEAFVKELLVELDRVLDERLVETFEGTLKRPLRWRVPFILRWPKRYKLVNIKGE